MTSVQRDKMRREIGSEFWDVPATEQACDLFPENTQWFLSGRSALQGIIKDIKRKKRIHSVAMPSWCCGSMIIPFLREGLEVHFYPVYWNSNLIQEITMDSDVLFLMDYFGYSSVAPDISGYSGIIIRDVTHSIFSTTYNDADYYFGSLRKWCGVWTGGYAWSRDDHVFTMEEADDHGYTVLRERAMRLKDGYMNGFIDNEGPGITDKEYLRVYREAEERLEAIGIAPAADRDIRLAKRLDVEMIKARRRGNAKILRSAFSNLLIFPEMNYTDCPMFVPILVPDGKRDALHHYLIQHEIYCPIHWPVSEHHKLDKRELYIYQNEISLVCDQRYTEEDMQRIVVVLREIYF